MGLRKPTEHIEYHYMLPNVYGTLKYPYDKWNGHIERKSSIALSQKLTTAHSSEHHTVTYHTEIEDRSHTHTHTQNDWIFFFHLIHIILNRAYYYQCEENYFDFSPIPRCSNAIVIQNWKWCHTRQTQETIATISLSSACLYAPLLICKIVIVINDKLCKLVKFIFVTIWKKRSCWGQKSSHQTKWRETQQKKKKIRKAREREKNCSFFSSYSFTILVMTAV